MNIASGFVSLPPNSTAVLQDHDKLIILLDHNKPGYFTSSQPNLFFYYIIMNQAILQAHSQTCYFIDHNEPGYFISS